jgi:hypothetical protein
MKTSVFSIKLSVMSLPIIAGPYIAFQSSPVRIGLSLCRTILGGLVVLGSMVHGMASASYGQNAITLNLSNQANVNMDLLRGFDPTTITGPSDPFPDTSNPFPSSSVGACTSSQFGCGVPQGSSNVDVLQNCDTGGATALPLSGLPLSEMTSCTPLTASRVNELGGRFQTLNNGLLSRLSTETSACAAAGPSTPSSRCTQIEFGFSQNVAEKGQVFDMSFSVRSLTDADGNPIASVGSYTQTLQEDGVTSTCGGTFTFNGDLTDANSDGRPDGLTLVGPAHQC